MKAGVCCTEVSSLGHMFVNFVFCRMRGVGGEAARSSAQDRRRGRSRIRQFSLAGTLKSHVFQLLFKPRFSSYSSISWVLLSLN